MLNSKGFPEQNINSTLPLFYSAGEVRGVPGWPCVLPVFPSVVP